MTCNIYYYFLFYQERKLQNFPIHGFKTTCKALLQPWVVQEALQNHVQGPLKPCTIKPWVAHGFKTMCKANIILRIIQFVISLLGRNITTSPPYCVFFVTHIFLRTIKFLLFNCFVRQDDYNISPILDCFLADIYFGL